jgi:nitroreductase
VPLLIALGTRLRPEHKVPIEEQVLSVGAAAMNMLNAVHLLGYGGMWVTGADCYDPTVNAALGCHAPDRLLGFLWVGTPIAPAAAVPRPTREPYVADWAG